LKQEAAVYLFADEPKRLSSRKPEGIEQFAQEFLEGIASGLRPEGRERE